MIRMISDRIRILDGGLSSALEKMGFSLDGDPLWTARLLKENPNAISDVHESFLEAGADILTTSSYQASIDGFKRHCQLSELESIELIKKSVDLTKEAKDNYKIRHDKEILVGGSVGPYGACLADGSEYSGDYIFSMTKCELQAWHRPRIGALLSGGVDFLVVETFPSLQEALCILDLMRKEFPEAKAWVSFSCKDGIHTNHGEKFSHAVSTCFNANPDQLIGIGVNCTAPKYISSLLEEAATVIPLLAVPRVVYPNSGGWYDSGIGWSEEAATPVFTESQVKSWLDLGATVIGGCCQVMPSNIKALSEMVNVKFRGS